MKTTKITALTLAALLLLPLAGNATTPRVLEDGREVSPSMLTLPTLPDGELAIQGCTACKRLTFRMAPTARFYVGHTEVTYADLKLHLRSYPQGEVTVVSPRGQNIVTRIQASGAVAK
jgi:hypothetical protein